MFFFLIFCKGIQGKYFEQLKGENQSNSNANVSIKGVCSNGALT